MATPDSSRSRYRDEMAVPPVTFPQGPPRAGQRDFLALLTSSAAVTSFGPGTGSFRRARMPDRRDRCGCRTTCTRAGDVVAPGPPGQHRRRRPPRTSSWTWMFRGWCRPISTPWTRWHGFTSPCPGADVGSCSTVNGGLAEPSTSSGSATSCTCARSAVRRWTAANRWRRAADPERSRQPRRSGRQEG